MAKKREKAARPVRAWAAQTWNGRAEILVEGISSRPDEWVYQIPVIIADARHYKVVPKRKPSAGERSK